MRPLLLTAAAMLAAATLTAQDAGEIELVHADVLVFDKKTTGNTRRLSGNVVFRQGDVEMRCDSAWLHPDENAVDAFGHIRITQGDSLTIFADSLRYDGNTRQADLYRNIRLMNKTTALTTDFLVYDAAARTARYHGGGTITEKDMKLTSRSGAYHAGSATYFFRDSVRLVSPKYTVQTDTLSYHSRTSTAVFLGPTHIESDGSTVYCESGWYDTRRDRLQYDTNVYVVSGSRRLRGDSLWYDQKSGLGRIFRNVEMADTAERTILRGHYAEYDERRGISFVTGRALLILLMDGDSMHLHADTLRNVSDSATGLRTLYAWNRVKFHMQDMQGMCDSLVYTEADSTIRLYRSPVLWSDGNQLTAALIGIRLWDGEVREMDMTEAAFIVSREDSAHYNQVKGRNMKGFFAGGALQRVLVTGNGQTIYYGREDGGGWIGVNRAECSDLVIHLEDSRVKRLTFLTMPDAALHPMGELPPHELILKDFRWLGDRRPGKAGDVFVW